MLELISKDEKEWWTCRNSHGDVGQIPVPYVTKVSIQTRNTYRNCIRGKVGLIFL